MSKLRNFLIGAGIATVGAVGTKMAVDYFKRKKEEEAAEETVEEAEPSLLSEEEDIDTDSLSEEEVAFVTVDPSSVQDFLDRSFGAPGRYVPTRPPKVFDYQGQQYMVIWAYIYTDEGRKMIGSVGYTADVTDYNINMEETPFAVEVNDEQITSGQGQTDGSEEVDFVLAAS